MPCLSRAMQRVPVAAPDHLDHVPAGAAKIGFEFLDDLAVAAHRTVEALQIAVDDENQVVEMFASGERDRAERFGLIHFAVAHERPHLAALLLDDAAVFEIAHEARLIDRHQRPQPHRHRRELPEVRHQPRMRIRRQALAVDFLAEIVHLLVAQPAEHECARIDAGRGVALQEHQVAAEILARRAPEMVETDVVQRGGGGETRNVTADVGVLVGAHHHCERIPAHIRANAVLDFLIARQRSSISGGMVLRYAVLALNGM